MSEPRRTWPPARDRDDLDRAGRPDYRAARRTARHLAEGWAIDAAEQRTLATEYREHLVAILSELRALQHAAGIAEHDCETCRKASRMAAGDGGPNTGDVS